MFTRLREAPGLARALARACVPVALLPLASCALLSIAAANKKPPEAPVNLNTASAEQLQEVPGIGPVTAEKILQMRKAYGPFKSVDDLLAIKGIGHKRLEKMRKYLTVGKTASPGRAVSAEHPAKRAKPASPQKSPAPHPSLPLSRGSPRRQENLSFRVA